MQPGASFNPFPGLRSFEPEEDYLFFGRERAIDELLRRLRQTRFLVVTGASGSGKSSLVLSGLVPSLYRGFMAGAGSSWRIAIFRPGSDPVGNLTAALQPDAVLGAATDLSRIFLRTTLERGDLGLVEAVREAKVPLTENILIVVDQFEELFRFHDVSSFDGAAAFVKLLTQAAMQTAVPIFIAVTIRADYLGECMRFSSLPEVVNAGQFLVPRMSREELRRAIAAPIAVGASEIAPRLVIRLLNDAGDDPEQLPVLQHALMRTWDYWRSHSTPGEPIDVPHYEAIGTMRNALSIHADEAYFEAESAGKARVARGIFKALTDTSSNPHGVRRPTTVHDLSEIDSVLEQDILDTVEMFQRISRSFLMPPPGAPMLSSTVIDLAHESLMRIWVRLKDWAEEERVSAERYLRISRAARWNEEGTAGLFRNPELGMALKWRTENRPTATWAKRLDPGFDRAMTFLDRSQVENSRLRAAAEKGRRRQLALAWTAATALLVLSVAAIGFALAARSERNRAKRYGDLAHTAVNQMLASVDTDAESLAGESRDRQRFRLELLNKASPFYQQLLTLSQNPTNAGIRADQALAYFHSGDIARLEGQVQTAIADYGTAIEKYTELNRMAPARPEYVERLGLAHNWMGEVRRTQTQSTVEDDAKALADYGESIEFLGTVVGDSSRGSEYQRELARTYDNRGILYKSMRDPDSALKDFTTAIELLSPLALNSAAPEYLQDFARSKNNLAQLIREQELAGNASVNLQDAIRIGEELTQRFPNNREYELELAQYYDNYALSLMDQGSIQAATSASANSLTRLENLAAPTFGVQLELAHAHAVRASILDQAGDRSASAEYDEALASFERLTTAQGPLGYRDWYGEALAAAAVFHIAAGDTTGAVLLLRRPTDSQVRRDATKRLTEFSSQLNRVERNRLKSVLESVK